jgi:hypothetical protein
MIAGTVTHDFHPPVLSIAKLAAGALETLSRTTSTRPLTPRLAPEATRASNWRMPEPKLTRGYFSQSPLASSATWLPSVPDALVSPVAGVTGTAPEDACSQSAEMKAVAAPGHLTSPAPADGDGPGGGEAPGGGLGDKPGGGEAPGGGLGDKPGGGEAPGGGLGDGEAAWPGPLSVCTLT